MRCPKCGYISFDHLDTCAKCAHGLSVVAGQLHGSAVQVASPFFLGSVLEEEPEAGEEAGGEQEEATLDLEVEEEDAVEEAQAAPVESSALTGIDVSDLVPPPEEAAGVLDLEGEAEEEIPQEAAEIEMPPEEAEEQDLTLEEGGEDLLSFDSDAGPGEEVEPAQAPMAEEDVFDLSALVEDEEGPSAEEEPRETASGHFDDTGEPAEESASALDLSLEDLPFDTEEALVEEEEPGGDELELMPLDVDEEGPLGLEEESPPLPDIPDLGLTLESDDERGEAEEED